MNPQLSPQIPQILPIIDIETRTITYPIIDGQVWREEGATALATFVREQRKRWGKLAVTQRPDAVVVVLAPSVRSSWKPPEPMW